MTNWKYTFKVTRNAGDNKESFITEKHKENLKDYPLMTGDQAYVDGLEISEKRSNREVTWQLIRIDEV
ncbi:MAG: hypothetical protein WC365_08775 [Candidatus Babeliales bacterium]|jgi:hypothetical protein